GAAGVRAHHPQLAAALARRIRAGRAGPGEGEPFPGGRPAWLSIEPVAGELALLAIGQVLDPDVTRAQKGDTPEPWCRPGCGGSRYGERSERSSRLRSCHGGWQASHFDRDQPTRPARQLAAARDLDQPAATFVLSLRVGVAGEQRATVRQRRGV